MHGMFELWYLQVLSMGMGKVDTGIGKFCKVKSFIFGDIVLILPPERFSMGSEAHWEYASIALSMLMRMAVVSLRRRSRSRMLPIGLKRRCLLVLSDDADFRLWEFSPAPEL
jgi:hypothetical protein